MSWLWLDVGRVICLVNRCCEIDQKNWTRKLERCRACGELWVHRNADAGGGGYDQSPWYWRWWARRIGV